MKYHAYVATLISLVFSSAVCAGMLNIPQSPNVSTSNAKANVLFVFDDSASMDLHFITGPYYQYCNYFNPSNLNGCNNNLQNSGEFYFSDPGDSSFTTRRYYYIFNIENELRFSRYALQNNTLLNSEWRIFDPKFNKIYYDPDLNYTPWKGPCYGDGTQSGAGYDCKDANIYAVRAHPKEGHANYSTRTNVTNYYYNWRRFYHRWTVSIDDKKYNGSRPTPSNMADGSNGQVDAWDTHAVFKILSDSAIKVELYKSIGSNGATKFDETTLSGGACYNMLGPQEMVKSMITSGANLKSNNGNGCRKVKEAIQNYANWMQYYWRRDFTATAAVSEIIKQFPDNNFGISYLNNYKGSVRYPIDTNPQNISLFQNSLLHKFYYHRARYGSTPLVTALDTAGKYYEGAFGNSPITSACQTNNAILLTDGYWNDNNLPGYGDQDGDGYGSSGASLSDVARYYYLKDLAPNLPGSATLKNTSEPTPGAVNLPPPKAKSMTTFGVSFGLVGNLKDGGDGWPNPAMQVNSDWGNPQCADGGRNCAEKIDDLWHATFNSSGAFIQANNIQELTNGLEKAFTTITSRSNQSAGGVASSAKMLADNNLIYQASFDSINWTGTVKAYSLSKDGVLSTTATWDSDNIITNQIASQRVVYTHNLNKGILFNWPGSYTSPSLDEINLAQISALIGNLSFNIDAMGTRFVSFLKGDQSYESSQGGQFRDRDKLLGDVVHSSPLYIPAPSLNYSDASYVSFKQANSMRAPMLAFGANDGMLHILNAQTGNPLLSYVPGYIPLWENLNRYARKTYTHRYFVDGQLVSSDFYSNTLSSWRTLLTGSLGRGGQAVFALDITNGSFPSTKTDASNTVMWEFSDANDADMGYILGKPQVVKMSNGKWAVVFGNGYNSQSDVSVSNKTDQNISPNGQAALFILFIDEGKNGWELGTSYHKILVGPKNQNGLSEPFAVDIDHDGTADYFYAGDLNGEMWRFDVSSNDPANWGSKKVYSTSEQAGSGLQPITRAPVVGPHPSGLSNGVMVYFGTGKYIEPSDLSQTNQTTQAMYGIWDKLDNSAAFKGTSQLLTQTIEKEVGDLRATTDHDIDWSIHRGWALILEGLYPEGENGSDIYLNKGEKVTSNPILRNGKIIFVSTIPAASSLSSCSTAKGTSWLMEISSKNGGRLSYAVFDINKDGKFDKDDYVKYTNQNGENIELPHSGVKTDSGEMQAGPTILASPDGEKEVKVTNGSGGVATQAENPGNAQTGRQSWQEVY